jgi:hypothetical protein
MGLLDGDMAETFAEAFGDYFLDGTLHRATRTDADNGDVTVAWSDIPIKYQPDKITLAMRQSADYSDKSAAFLILQVGVSPEIVRGDQFTAGQRWAVKSVESDPASSHWVIMASPA